MIYLDILPIFENLNLEAAVKQAVQAVLDHQSISQPVALSVVLTDDEQLHQLNRDYLGIDAPTDVLSFRAAEPDPETGLHYLGDVLISIPLAATQAEKAGHPLTSEVQLLCVHGVLHLLEYDHAEDDEKNVMWTIQAEILAALGLDGITLPE